MASSPLPRLRRICLALPQSVEVEAWGAATFRCGKIFAMFSHASDQTHSGGRHGVWLKAAPGNQELMVRDRPDRFFVPPYVGPSGWIGVRLDQDPDWTEVALLVEESWRLIAPKKVLKTFEEKGATRAAKTSVTKPAKTSTKPAKKAAARSVTRPATKSAPQRKAKRSSSASHAASTPRSARTAAATRPAASRKAGSPDRRASSSATRRPR